MEDKKIIVCALYHFVRLPDFEDLRVSLRDLMDLNQVRGTILLAHEGINGTIAGSRTGIDAVLGWLKSHAEFKMCNCVRCHHNFKAMNSRQKIMMYISSPSPNLPVFL